MYGAKWDEAKALFLKICSKRLSRCRRFYDEPLDPGIVARDNQAYGNGNVNRNNREKNYIDIISTAGA